MRPLLPFFSLCFCLAINAQNVEFDSETTLLNFINAGADLDNNGEISLTEAAQVTELFFNMEPVYETSRKVVFDDSIWDESDISDPYYGCSDDSDCDCIGDYIDGELDLQNLQHFTSLKHLGINRSITNVSLPPGLLSFHLRGAEVAEHLILPSSLDVLEVAYSDLLSINLDNCTNLTQLNIRDVDFLVSPMLPVNTHLEAISLDIALNLNDINHEGLQYLDLSFSPPFDINALSSLKALFIKSNQDLIISNSSLEKLFVQEAAFTSITSCTSLVDAYIGRAELSDVTSNPKLERLRIHELEESNDEVFVSNCPNLEYFFGSGNVNNLLLVELPKLKHLRASATSGPYFGITDQGAIEHLNVLYSHNLGIDYAALPKLRHLDLHKANVGSELDLSASTQLEQLKLYEVIVNSLVSSSADLNRVSIWNREDNNLELKLHSDFNPMYLELSCVDNPNLNFTKFSRLAKATFRGVDNLEVMDLSNAADLEYLTVQDNRQLEHLKLCEANSSLNLALSGHFSESNPDLNVEIPFDSGDELEDFCIYYLEVSVANCNSDVSTSSNNQLDQSHQNVVSVYPNPTTDFLNWNSSIEEVSQVNIFDLSGKIVRRFDRPSSQVYLEDLEDGLYLVNIKTDSQTYSEKVLVKRSK